MAEPFEESPLWDEIGADLDTRGYLVTSVLTSRMRILTGWILMIQHVWMEGERQMMNVQKMRIDDAMHKWQPKGLETKDGTEGI